MRKFIENMREKPRGVKQRFAFLVSISITVIIFVFWLATWDARMEIIASSKTQNSALESASSGLANVSAVFKNVKNIFSSSFGEGGVVKKKLEEIELEINSK